MAFVEGEQVYIVESHLHVTPALIIKKSGEFYTIRLLNSGGAITLRQSRLFQTKEEAEQRTRKAPAVPSVVEERYSRSPYSFDNSRSRFGL